MAAHCMAVMRLKALFNLGTKASLARNRTGLDWTWTSRYRTRAGTAPSGGASASETGRGESDLLMEFPQAKSLLHSTVSRSLGQSDVSQYIQYHCTDGEVKRATVTLLWPQRIETEGFGSRKVQAERRAAAAACRRLKELGILSPGNQLPSRKRSRKPGWQPSVWEDAEEALGAPEDLELSRTSASGNRGTARSPGVMDPKVAEALSIFSNPKALLVKVIQVAASSNRVKELLHYRTSGGKVKECELTVRWPQPMTFRACGRRRLEAETHAAALACLRMKDLKLLDEQNSPLTHAKYHQEEVREAGRREKRPCRLEIPEHLQRGIQEYLAEYPVNAEAQKLWDEEEERSEQRQSSSLSEEDEDNEGDRVPDAITGRPYRPLSTQEAKHLSDSLLRQWEKAGPAQGAELPVDFHREKLVAASEASRVVVVAGETGCGKTTRIPRFLLEGHIMAGEGAHCNILVTQPRRISAVSVAQRVAQEMGPALRHAVGYQVRLESRPPERSGGALLFLTVGVLLRKLQADGALRSVSHVLVDEVHERDVNTDLLLALLRTALTRNPRLRVVLMSATGDTQRLADYFGGCPVLRVPGSMHPVRERYLEEVLQEMGRPPVAKGSMQGQNDAGPDLDLVADVIDHIHLQGEPGAVLCFLPGWQDIKSVQQRLEEKRAFRSGSQVILPLHSSMSVADQQAVFQRPLEGRRKIVLATNIAETSITIDDIVHVVDVGSQKEQSYDPRTKVSCLDTVWISHSNVIQRRGRAGRCQPGHAYHLFPRQQLETMTTFPVPEIQRTPLESLVVQAKIHSPHIKAEDFLSQVLDPPDAGAVRDAVKTLQDIGVLDEAECLTPLGERVACVSCDPRLAKALVLSALFRCVLPMLSVAACLTRDPFYNSLQNRALVAKAKEALSGSSCSDYVVFSRAVQGWRETSHRDSRQEYLDSYSLSGASLWFIRGLTQQFSENLVEAGLVAHSADCLRPSTRVNHCSREEQLFKAVLFAGFYPNLIQVKRGTVTKGGRFRPDNLSYRTKSGPVLLHRSTVNRGEKQLPSRWLTFFSAVKSNGNVFIRDSSTVHPLALLLLTDCDLVERVYEDRAEVSLPEHSLVRWEMSAQSWELLWEFRTSIQAMIYRNLRPLTCDSVCEDSTAQDGHLISLLVDLLNSTDPDSNGDDQSDAE
ncbi:ATP-dependent RNA helicase DHX30 [Electrophorus electricus]|uniref:ATP-dependent RNA helicase DHX30 n=1 Tax=Electrophorus electricus TaxID=8005 RepID=UPI0015D073AB|nr:ATP-dependent RNA helicase DHX30 [Electrophorus electricus]